MFPRLRRKTDKEKLENDISEKQQLENIQKGTCLVDTVNRLPPELRMLLHTIEFLADEGLSLAYGILE